jgi:hypothetical protein
MIYRVEAVKQIDFGEGVFGGAADAIFICDLAGKGKLVYVNEPKWEYRQHSGQASKSIEEKFNKNLELELIRIAGTESSISQPTIKAIRRISTERRLLRIWGNDNNANLVQRVLLSGRELLDSRTSMDGFADFARIKAWLFLRDSRR